MAIASGYLRIFDKNQKTYIKLEGTPGTDRMKFELIRSLQNLEWYGKIPCLPINYNSTEGKRDPFREIGVSHVFEDRR